VKRQSNILAKLVLSTVLTVLLALFSWRQYSKYEDGRGLAYWLLPTDAPIAALVGVFVLLPLVVAIVVGWAMARDFE
jgi:hypothetical protein